MPGTQSHRAVLEHDLLYHFFCTHMLLALCPKCPALDVLSSSGVTSFHEATLFGGVSIFCLSERRDHPACMISFLVLLGKLDVCTDLLCIALPVYHYQHSAFSRDFWTFSENGQPTEWPAICPVLYRLSIQTGGWRIFFLIFFWKEWQKLCHEFY